MKLLKALLPLGLLLIVLPALAAVQKRTITINVLDSQTRSVVLDSSGVPKNCDMVNYDAYCHNSITTLVTHTLLVQVGNERPFKVSCRVDSVWSHCSALRKGQVLEAKPEKRGVSVYLLDEKGKLRQQFYSYVGGRPNSTDETLTSMSQADKVSPPTIAGSSAANAAVVQCRFTSTPSGAEISIDGHYVGSTPSLLNVYAGDHAIEVSLPGFDNWTRDLTVSPGSELRVNAVLQKLQ